jgi:hypothetical protein
MAICMLSSNMLIAVVAWALAVGLADMPTAMSLVLKKPHPTDSWGVGLVKEGVMCVVGKVRATLSEQDRTKELVCGDLILHVRNERGEEA